MLPEPIRQAVFDRDGRRCLDCGTRRHLSVDHVVSTSEGGSDDFDNLQTLCVPCNSRKGPHPIGPKPGRSRRRSAPLTIRLDEALKAKVGLAAREADQSVGEWIVASLADELALIG